MQTTGTRGPFSYGNFLVNLMARDLRARYRLSVLGFV
jgi:ABC-type polysaccharide/polyol phosphate export permease